jgi:3-keto-disaccharide hydrolase
MRVYKFLIISTAVTILSFSDGVNNDDWQFLFNGKDLNGWNTYLGPPLNDAGKMLSDIPLGLNNDPNHVFTVVKDNGENVIRISGENWGAISTKKEFENLHLQLMFKWGSLSWGQKKNKKKDSGLLYFSVGKNGADYGAWMRSQEFQIEEGNCGDYWGVAGGMEDIPAIKKSDSEYVYNTVGQMHTFSATSDVGRHCIKQGDAEKPSGEWNVLDLYCHGDTSVHVINGKVMMVLYHSLQSDDDEIRPLTKGKLQIQSEGAEIFYKQIKIKKLDEIPSEFLKQ